MLSSTQQRLAMSSQSLLITGEPGTGKSSLARKIHQVSTHKNASFMALNIASLGEQLFESELFGHAMGAFTGAQRSHEGFLYSVGQGTLFLDEIGELPLRLQSKLLHVLEEKKYFRVGETIERSFNGRLLFATNADLELLCQKGQFRRDLWERMKTFRIHLAPLRQSPQVIENYLVTKLAGKQVSPELWNYLQKNPWKGNFRELKHTLDYILAMTDGELGMEHLPETLASSPQLSCNTEENWWHNQYTAALESFERQFLQQKLRLCHGKINAMSRLTSMNKVTLLKKLRQHQLHPALD